MKRVPSQVIAQIVPPPFDPDAATVQAAWRSIARRLPRGTTKEQRAALREMWFMGIGWAIYQLESRMTSDGSAEWFEHLVDELTEELKIHFITQRF
jgi:hypothetical protein